MIIYKNNLYKMIIHFKRETKYKIMMKMIIHNKKEHKMIKNSIKIQKMIIFYKKENKIIKNCIIKNSLDHKVIID